ncbi:MAG: hypothetical protein ACOXZK_11335 [Bacteroidales bacterium]
MLKKQILTIISIAIFCQGIAQTNFYQTEVFKEIGNKKEDISKRDAYSKHYINDDGSYTALIGSGPIHYEKNGRFEDIDTELLPNNDPVFVYANKTNIFESYFGLKTSDGVKRAHLNFLGTKQKVSPF